MKAVLITGSSKGIGAAAARLFRKEGYFVFLHGRNLKDLELIEKELGQKDSILVGDLGNSEDVDLVCKNLEDRVKFQGLKLQTLINNAGIFHRQKASEQRADFWESQFRVNILGPARLTERLVPLLAQHAPSSIVNIATTLALRPAVGTSAYGASKAAMVHWTTSLAVELAPQQIRVNCVCPGLVDTPIHDFHFLPAAEKEKVKEQLKNLQPLGRIGEASEIADSIFFLASQKSKWTTGSILSVDGGINLT
ncbi:MAG: SDR family NAD(P)-dependent oxidoreductase [Bdellovibrio sp.]|jgi:NAD(P)-dependent dehydrogenase (short-subunit alcohol dehydrogenase family)